MELDYENLSLDGVRQKLAEEQNKAEELDKTIKENYNKLNLVDMEINRLEDEIMKRTLKDLKLSELYCTYGVPGYHYSEFEIYRVLKSTENWVDYVEYLYRNDDGELYLRVEKHKRPLLSFAESIKNMKVIDEEKFKELIDKALMLEEIPYETDN